MQACSSLENISFIGAGQGLFYALHAVPAWQQLLKHVPNIQCSFEIFIRVQVGCSMCWTVKVFMRKDLRPYCRISTRQMEHTGHGPSAEHPKHRRRGRISDQCRSYVAHFVLEGLKPEKVIRCVQDRLKQAFADDPCTLGGREVSPSLLCFELCATQCDTRDLVRTM